MKKFQKKVSTLDMMVNQQSPNPYQNLVVLLIGFGPFTCADSFSAIKILLKKIKEFGSAETPAIHTYSSSSAA
jgi:hypothetical protein